MKVSFESPLCLLEKSREYNDYDYALVHLFEKYEQYFLFFKNSIKLGRDVILDNSLFELGKAFENDVFAKWVEKLNPTYYVVPDEFNNMGETIEKFVEWNKYYKEIEGKKIGVIHGTTYNELKECYKFMSKNADVIAISFGYDYYKKNKISNNEDLNLALGRVNLIYSLINDGVWCWDKPHHLLGCSLPFEVGTYKNIKNIVSVDTSSPVVHGVLGIKYNSLGLNKKKKIKIIDLFESQINQSQLNDILYNIKIFKKIAGGD